MKKLITAILLLFSVITHAQKVVCKDTVIDNSYYKEDTSCVKLLTPKICYKASIKVTPVTKEKKDTTYISKCNLWCWLGLSDPIIKIDKIITTYYTVPDTTIVQTPYDCSTTTVKCDTISVLVPKFDTITKCEVVYPELKAGAKLQGTFAEQLWAARDMGIEYIRINSVELKSYNGDISGIKKWHDEGYKIILNVTWIDTNPAPFAKGKELETFKTKFDQLVKDAGSMVEVFVIENEETNTTFYDYSKFYITDYLNELKAAVDICERYQKKVADGGLHIKVVADIMAGNLKKDNRQRQDSCIKFFKSISYKNFYVNTHTEFSNDDFVADQVLKSVAFLRTSTGHDVLSNEYHTDHCSPEFVATTVNEWKKSDVKYLIVWGGNYVAGQKFPGGSEADAFNVGSVITKHGEAYRDAINK